jgi:hypothetical protein
VTFIMLSRRRPELNPHSPVALGDGWISRGAGPIHADEPAGTTHTDSGGYPAYHPAEPGLNGSVASSVADQWLGGPLAGSRTQARAELTRILHCYGSPTLQPSPTGHFKLIVHSTDILRL